MESLANFFKHDFNNGIFELFDKDGNIVYREYSSCYWYKKKYNKNGIEIYFENSNGYWKKCKYNKNKNLIYFEDSTGYWYKKEYNKNGNEIYYQNSDGTITDNRPKICKNNDQIIIINGKKY